MSSSQAASPAQEPENVEPAIQGKLKPGPAIATLVDSETGEEVSVELAPRDQQPGEAPSPEEAQAGEDDESLIPVRFEKSGRETTLRVPGPLAFYKLISPPCPACGCKHLYVQRDFNREFGVGIVGLAALIGVVWSHQQGTIFPLMGMLLLSTVLDFGVYWLMPPVVVCYRCLTSYRNVAVSNEIRDYDQEIADGYAFSGGVLGSGYVHGEKE